MLLFGFFQLKFLNKGQGQLHGYHNPISLGSACPLFPCQRRFLYTGLGNFLLPVSAYKEENHKLMSGTERR